MQDLRQSNNTERKGFAVPKFNIVIFLITNKPLIRRIFIYSIILTTLIFPSQVATVISNWVNSFIGTLVHNIDL